VKNREVAVACFVILTTSTILGVFIGYHFGYVKAAEDFEYSIQRIRNQAIGEYIIEKDKLLEERAMKCVREHRWNGTVVLYRTWKDFCEAAETELGPGWKWKIRTLWVAGEPAFHLYFIRDKVLHTFHVE